MLANVKIKQNKENPNIHRVFVDGKQIEKITHLDFRVDPLEVPTLNLETMSGIDFEGQAVVNFLETPFTIENACKILREELLKHGDLYNGFLESMKSVIQESEKWEKNDCVCNSYDEKKEDLERLAELMLKRIIGED